MPELATTIIGRGWVRIAFDWSTVLVNSSPGYSSGESPDCRSLTVSSS
jgi:hypothetical protein